MMKRGEPGHIIAAQRQLENAQPVRTGRKHIGPDSARPSSATSSILPVSNHVPITSVSRRPSTASSLSNILAHNGESIAQATQLRTGRRVAVHSSSSASSLDNPLATTRQQTRANATSETIGAPPAPSSSAQIRAHNQATASYRGMYKEQEIAKRREQEQKEREAMRRSVQEQMRRESAQRYEQEELVRKENSVRQPHMTRPSRIDPAATVSQETINQYLRSKPIWRFKDKDYGQYKIS